MRPIFCFSQLPPKYIPWFGVRNEAAGNECIGKRFAVLQPSFPEATGWNGMEWLKRQQPNDTEEDRGGFKGVIGSLA